MIVKTEKMTDAQLIEYLKDKLLLITNELAIVKTEYPDAQERIDKAVRTSVNATDVITEHQREF
ncbi:hypothetical protein AB7W88_05190 [Providencia vermicola]|uniref:hypothetical protein n=1 Tax=Providencia TaxID=586 RepID=UPI0018C960EE|nr:MULTISPECIES: hypothetical protein [Providencia]ELR5271168.1 hypothetical protein [Providencia rettgeri]MCR4081083.1 hypothetical protein [Providencia stuartii]MDN7223181.1 hypothetical protein [Providencia stuartii]QPN39483.1 hypothetical protein I3B46_15300 [Providencia sp. 2.29]WAZ79833.1 hypothetical protein O4001_06490 [Providencia stuartii]